MRDAAERRRSVVIRDPETQRAMLSLSILEGERRETVARSELSEMDVFAVEELIERRKALKDRSLPGTVRREGLARRDVVADEASNRLYRLTLERVVQHEALERSAIKVFEALDAALPATAAEEMIERHACEAVCALERIAVVDEPLQRFAVQRQLWHAAYANELFAVDRDCCVEREAIRRQEVDAQRWLPTFLALRRTFLRLGADLLAPSLFGAGYLPMCQDLAQLQETDARRLLATAHGRAMLPLHQEELAVREAVQRQELDLQSMQRAAAQGPALLAFLLAGEHRIAAWADVMAVEDDQRRLLDRVYRHVAARLLLFDARVVPELLRVVSGPWGQGFCAITASAMLERECIGRQQLVVDWLTWTTRTAQTALEQLNRKVVSTHASLFHQRAALDSSAFAAFVATVSAPQVHRFVAAIALPALQEHEALTRALHLKHFHAEQRATTTAMEGDARGLLLAEEADRRDNSLHRSNSHAIRTLQLYIAAMQSTRDLHDAGLAGLFDLATQVLVSRAHHTRVAEVERSACLELETLARHGGLQPTEAVARAAAMHDGQAGVQRVACLDTATREKAAIVDEYAAVQRTAQQQCLHGVCAINRSALQLQHLTGTQEPSGRWVVASAALHADTACRLPTLEALHRQTAEARFFRVCQTDLLPVHESLARRSIADRHAVQLALLGLSRQTVRNEALARTALTQQMHDAVFPAAIACLDGREAIQRRADVVALQAAAWLTTVAEPAHRTTALLLPRQVDDRDALQHTEALRRCASFHTPPLEALATLCLASLADELEPLHRRALLRDFYHTADRFGLGRQFHAVAAHLCVEEMLTRAPLERGALADAEAVRRRVGIEAPFAFERQLVVVSDQETPARQAALDRPEQAAWHGLTLEAVTSKEARHRWRLASVQMLGSLDRLHVEFTAASALVRAFTTSRLDLFENYQQPFVVESATLVTTATIFDEEEELWRLLETQVLVQEAQDRCDISAAFDTVAYDSLYRQCVANGEAIPRRAVASEENASRRVHATNHTDLRARLQLAEAALVVFADPATHVAPALAISFAAFESCLTDRECILREAMLLDERALRRATRQDYSDTTHHQWRSHNLRDAIAASQQQLSQQTRSTSEKFTLLQHTQQGAAALRKQRQALEAAETQLAARERELRVIETVRGDAERSATALALIRTASGRLRRSQPGSPAVGASARGGSLYPVEASMALTDEDERTLRSFDIVQRELERIEYLCLCSQLAPIWVPLAEEPIAEVPRDTCVALKERMEECVAIVNDACADVSALYIRRDNRMYDVGVEVDARCAQLLQLRRDEAKQIHDRTAVLHQREDELLHHIRRGTGTLSAYALFRALPLEHLVKDSITHVRSLSEFDHVEQETATREVALVTAENAQLQTLTKREKLAYLVGDHFQLTAELYFQQFAALCARGFVQTLQHVSSVLDHGARFTLELLHPRLYRPKKQRSSSSAAKTRRSRSSRSTSARRPRWTSATRVLASPSPPPAPAAAAAAQPAKTQQKKRKAMK